MPFRRWMSRATLRAGQGSPRAGRTRALLGGITLGALAMSLAALKSTPAAPVRNHQIKQDAIKQNEIKRNEIKQNEIKQDESRRLSAKQVFPADSPWNTDISRSPVDPNSDTLIASIGLNKPLHPDFGTVYNGAPNGIPYVVVPGTQPKVPVKFTYADESDPGPYPLPPDAPIEGGPNGTGDRHVLVIDRDHWKLYELFNARQHGDGWMAGSGAIFDLNSNRLRPAGWTSADAAGLPIFPGLVRYDEVMEQKAIRHALRFTCVRTRRAYVAPARHFASRSNDPNLPPMGMRVRLKASVDITHYPAAAQVILTALKKYGMFLADNGSDWFVSGAPDPRWSDDDLNTLKRIQGKDFEVVMAPTLPVKSLHVKAQKHLTRKWTPSQGYVFVPCPCESGSGACPCRSWTIQFRRRDGTNWGSVSCPSRTGVLQDSEMLLRLERQYETRIPGSSLFKNINFQRVTQPFCNHPADRCVPLPAEFAEEVTSEEKDVRQEAVRTIEQTKIRLARAWEEWIGAGNQTKPADTNRRTLLAREGEAIGGALVQMCALDAILADDATPHGKRIRRELTNLSTAINRIAEQEQSLAGATSVPPKPPMDPAPTDPAHPSEADKIAAQEADDRGLVFYRKDKYAEAADAFLLACRLDSTNAIAQTHLALLLEKQDRYAQEETFFRELVKRAPMLPHQHYWLGKALYMQKKYAEADTELRKAIQIAPDQWVYHHYLAASLREQGKKAEAEQQRKEADRIRTAHPTETP